MSLLGGILSIQMLIAILLTALFFTIGVLDFFESNSRD